LQFIKIMCNISITSATLKCFLTCRNFISLDKKTILLLCLSNSHHLFFLSQVQVSVLKEEKRNLLRQVDELSKTNSCNDTLHRHRSQSFSEQCTTTLRNLKNSGGISTRDMGTMCGVITRDVGVSYQPVSIFSFNRTSYLSI